MARIQFYFIEDQDYLCDELREFKDYLHQKNYFVNSLYVGKEVKSKDESLLKLIDCNLLENKKERKLYIVCSGPLSLSLLSELNCLSFDGMITFECSSLSTVNLNDFSYLKKYAGKKVNKENWKSYFTIFPESARYLKKYISARSKLGKNDGEFKLYQVFKNKDKYYINVYQKNNKQDEKLITKGRLNNLESKEELYNTIVDNL